MIQMLKSSSNNYKCIRLEFRLKARITSRLMPSASYITGPQ